MLLQNRGIFERWDSLLRSIIIIWVTWIQLELILSWPTVIVKISHFAWHGLDAIEIRWLSKKTTGIRGCFTSSRNFDAHSICFSYILCLQSIVLQSCHRFLILWLIS